MSGPVPLPTEKNATRWSARLFKDKDSQEHFEIRTHKRLIDIHQPTPKTVDSLQRLDHLPAGVDIEIRLAFGLGPCRHPRQEARDDPAVPRRRRSSASPCSRPGRARARHPHAGRRRLRGVQLGFGAVREKALSKGELGHLKKADAPPLRTVKEFRDQAGELTWATP